MPAYEAVDLILSLPAGSHYVASVDPTLAWPPERHWVMDVVDSLLQISWQMVPQDEGTEPPKVIRPRDRLEQAKTRAEARMVRERLESDGWTEV